MRNTIRSLKNSAKQKFTNSQEKVKKISQAVTAATILCLGSGCTNEKEVEDTINYTYNYGPEFGYDNGIQAYATNERDSDGNRIFRTVYVRIDDSTYEENISHPDKNISTILDEILYYEENPDIASDPYIDLLEYFEHIGPSRQIEEMKEMERILLWKDSKYSAEEKAKLVIIMTEILNEKQLTEFKFSNNIFIHNDFDFHPIHWEKQAKIFRHIDASEDFANELLKNGKERFLFENIEYFKLENNFFTDEILKKSADVENFWKILPYYLKKHEILDIKIFQDILLKSTNVYDFFSKVQDIKNNGLNINDIFTDEILIRGLKSDLTLDLLQYSLLWDDGNISIANNQSHITKNITPRLITELLNKYGINEDTYKILERYSSPMWRHTYEIHPKFYKAIENFERKNPEIIQNYGKISNMWK